MNYPKYLPPDQYNMTAYLAILKDVKTEIDLGMANYICLSAETMGDIHGYLAVKSFVHWIDNSIDHSTSLEGWLFRKGLLDTRPCGANILEQRKVSHPIRMAWISYLIQEIENATT